jgi:Carboxypeptidase regulatory-like domain
VRLSKSCHLVLWSALAAWGLAPQAPSPAVELQRATYLQRTVGDLDGAIQSYRQILASHPADRNIVAQAEHGLEQALQQKGDPSAAGQDSKPKGAVLEGKVIQQNSGAPLKKTMLTLSPSNVGGTGRTMTTESDEEGRFSFPRVEPGIYSLKGERAGYASQAYNAHSGSGYGAPIPLKEGDEVKNIVFKLVPNALLAGKVLDEDGDPVSRAQVMVLRTAYRTSGKQLQSFTSGTTGANGEFSVSVPPGQYYLLTLPMTTFFMGPGAGAQSAEPLKDGPEMAYGPTYYPDAQEELGALPINATGGADMRGMDIRLAKAKTYRIRGQVAASSPAARMLQLVPKTVSAGVMPKGAPVQSDGSFEFLNVLPGTYHLIGSGQNGISIYRSPVVVTDRHIVGLPVALSPMGELTGTVTIEGADKLPPAQTTIGFDRSNILVGFDSFENGSNPSATVKDGKFSVQGILPDRYHPWIGHPPKGCWVKEIRYDNRDVKDEGIDLTNGITGPVEIVLSPTAGDISGVVVDESGNPVPGATVLLLSKSGAYLNRYAANTDYQGKFQLYPVRPGDYTVFAWEDVSYLAWFDPEFLKAYSSRGVAVPVAPSDQKVLTVKVIPMKEPQK